MRTYLCNISLKHVHFTFRICIFCSKACMYCRIYLHVRFIAFPDYLITVH